MNKLEYAPSVIGKTGKDMILFSYVTLTTVFSEIPLEVICARKERNLEVQAAYQKENCLLLKMKAWKYR